MRRADHFYKETAEQLSLSEELVKKVNSFYWKYGVKEPMIKGKEAVLFVKGLGTFFLSKNRLHKRIFYIIGQIRKIQTGNNDWQDKKRDSLNVYYREELKKLLIMRNKLACHNYYLKERQNKINEQID